MLDRLEDSKTGNLLPQAFHCEIPADRLEQARATAQILGDEVWKRFPWACGADGGPTLPTTTDPTQALLNRTWKPTLSVTGADGFPELKNAGNVLRPYTAFKLSLRLPPLVDGNRAAAELKALLEDNAPYNAKVTFHPDGRAGALGATGWNAPDLAPWLEGVMNSASQAHFGAPVGYIGQGGTIPLMSLLQQGFPKAQMMVCGVLGPKSNAHGPNEYLHIPTCKRLTATVADVLAALDAHGIQDRRAPALALRITRLSELRTQLAEAAQRLAAGAVFEPSDASAVAAFRDALTLDPRNRAAAKGLADIEGQVLDDALRAASEQRFADADALLAGLGYDAAGIAALRDSGAVG